jgi:hypothetical protein
MVKLSVAMEVEELVIAIQEVMAEMSDKYLTFVWLGLFGFIVLIFLASLVGSLCGLSCYNFYQKRRKTLKKRKKSYHLAKTSAATEEKDI